MDLELAYDLAPADALQQRGAIVKGFMRPGEALAGIDRGGPPTDSFSFL